MAYTVEYTMAGDTVCLTVKNEDMTGGRCSPINVPAPFMNREATMAVWRSLRQAANEAVDIAVLQGAQKDNILFKAMLILVRTAYWEAVAKAGKTPTHWVCVVYQPGLLGGMVCDDENKGMLEVQEGHPWEQDTCGLFRLDNKEDHKCRGARPDMWVARDA